MIGKKMTTKNQAKKLLGLRFSENTRRTINRPSRNPETAKKLDHKNVSAPDNNALRGAMVLS